MPKDEKPACRQAGVPFFQRERASNFLGDASDERQPRGRKKIG
jgi:hypothetical protein